MKKILCIMFTICCICSGDVFAQQLLTPVQCHNDTIPHQHTTLYGNWLNLVMCDHREYVAEELVLVIRFGTSLKSYSMWIGPMYYLNSDYRIGYQYSYSGITKTYEL